MLSKQVAANIKRARIAQGLSRPALASRFDPPTVAQQLEKLERGERRLTIDWLERTARALGMEPVQLLSGDRTRPVTSDAVTMEVGKAIFQLIGGGRSSDHEDLARLAAMLGELEDVFSIHPRAADDVAVARPVIDLILRKSLD